MGNTLKKALTITVSAMTAFWSVGVAAFAPLAAGAASSAAVSTGDLVKASLPAVYYVGANGKRYVFPNEKTYKTWWSGFSAVKTITDAELASVAIGGNVTYRPGSRLVKITTDPKVYLVGAAAELHPISDEATANALFGTSWSQKIDDVPDAFFTNYTVSSSTVATALGMGALPVGTLVKFNGNNYVVAKDGVWMVNGDVSIYSAVVMPSTQAQFDAWTGGTVAGTINAADILGLVSPDRSGTLDGGTGSTPSSAGVSVKVTQIATNLTMSSTVSGVGSQNTGKSMVQVCSDKTITVDGFKVSSSSGTIGFNTIMAWFQGGDNIYEVTGTSNGDSVGEFAATDADTTFSGCQDFAFYAATSSNGGVLNLRLNSVSYTASGAAAAAMVDGGSQVLQNRNAVPVTATDLMDIAFSNGVNMATLQTDGTKQQIFTVQAAVSNNDAYIPNVVFKLSGSINVSNCELRISGAVASTNYKWVGGKYIVFELPESARVMTETTKTWELWCEVNGEAGQTVTPQLVWPAPYFWFFDNIRVTGAVASAPSGKEGVAPSATRMSVTGTAGTTAGVTALAGASATVEAVNLNNVKDTAGVTLDDEKTNGTTNTTAAVFKVKVRGSKATLSNLVFTMTGTDGDTGLTACQIKFGQRNDKGEINTSAVSLADYSMSNYGGENNVSNAGNVTVTANKQLQVGDWLIVFECDVTASGNAYANGDVQAIQIVAGSANLSFDVGTTSAFPTGAVTGTTLTMRLLTALSVAANSTTRYLVANANDAILGEYTITGPSQEGVNVSSIGITFPAGIVGSNACTTVTLRNASGADLATTSQSLTAAGTLTFSVTLPIAKNAEAKIRVVCTQAASNPGSAGTTVTNATVFNAISGTGQSSAQSFSLVGGTNFTAVNGASVAVATAGTVTSNVGQLQPSQIIGPSEQLKIYTLTTSASIHEDQNLNTFALTLTKGSNALASDLATITVKAEGYTVSGTAAAAETTICTRTVTGASPVTISCVFSSNQVKLLAGQTGIITVYATGNSLGSIGNDSTPTDGIITPSVTITNSTATSQILFKGSQSQTLVANSANTGAVNGRVVTPAGAQVRVVNKSIPSTTLPGQANMVLGKMDLIISGTSITLTDLAGTCLTNATDVCDGTSANSTVTAALDSTVLTHVSAVNAQPTWSDDGSLSQLVTVGTHDLELRLTETDCGTGENVQLVTNEFGFTVAGVPTVTQSFASAGAGAFPVTILPDFNSQAGNVLTHPSNLCG